MANSIVQDLNEQNPVRKVDFVIKENLITQGDEKLIRLAMSNLLRNAWKYTAKTDNPRIALGNLFQDNTTIFFLRDNGVGFDTKLAQKLFIPFQRLHSEAEFPGTGIGLAIVDSVIKRHRGKIWAESKPGKGAIFYFTLPT